MNPPGQKTQLRGPMTDGASRVAAWTEIPTSPYMPADPGQRWLIQTDEGELQLVENESELTGLLRLGRVNGRTPVYTVGDGPRALGEIPEIARLLSKDVSSEPPIRRDQRSPDRAKLSEELAILNRPLDTEIEYYDEAPVRRWPKRVAFVIALAAATLGAYLFAVPRLPAWRSFVLAHLAHPAHPLGPVAQSASATAPRPPAPAAAANTESSLPLATATVERAPAPPAVDPSPPAETHVTTPSTIAASADGAPIAEQRARGPEAHKTSHALKRHASRKRTTAKR